MYNYILCNNIICCIIVFTYRKYYNNVLTFKYYHNPNEVRKQFREFFPDNKLIILSFNYSRLTLNSSNFKSARHYNNIVLQIPAFLRVNYTSPNTRQSILNITPSLFVVAYQRKTILLTIVKKHDTVGRYLEI